MAPAKEVTRDKTQCKHPMLQTDEPCNIVDFQWQQKRGRDTEREVSLHGDPPKKFPALYRVWLNSTCKHQKTLAVLHNQSH